MSCCQIVKRVYINNYISLAVLPMTPKGRSSLLKLVEKMIRGFFVDSSACSTNMWMPLPLHGDGEVKIMVKDALHGSGLPGRRTIVLSTSAAIPVPPKRVFDFLSDDRARPKVSRIRMHLTLKQTLLDHINYSRSIYKTENRRTISRFEYIS